MQQWTIKDFHTKSGRQPVQEFVYSLDPQTQAKILRTVNLLSEHGPHIGMPYTKQLNRSLFELRIRGKVEVRIFYGYTGQFIYLVHAFQKKSQQIPRKELTLAMKRLKVINP